MSELKAFTFGLGQYTEDGSPCVVAFDGEKNPRLASDEKFYLKSEADKAIAELEEKRDTAEKLLNKALVCISNGKNHMMSLARKCNHVNYKRCLAMAEACMHKRWRPDEGFDYARSTRHMKKWLELAEKFKEAK